MCHCFKVQQTSHLLWCNDHTFLTLQLRYLVAVSVQMLRAYSNQMAPLQGMNGMKLTQGVVSMRCTATVIMLFEQLTDPGYQPGHTAAG